METDLQTLMKDLDSDNLKISLTSQPGRRSADTVRSFPLSGGNRTSQVQSGPVQSVPLSKWPEMLRQKFQEKLQEKITELQEEHDRRDKADKDLLKKELQSKTHQKEVEVQQLQEEIQKKETNLKSLTEKLQSNNKEFEKQQAEVHQLQEEIQKMEIGLKSLMEDLESDIFEISLPSQAERRSAGPFQSSSSSWFGRNRTSQVQSGPIQSVFLSQWPFILRQKFQEKLQKKITELEELKQAADRQSKKTNESDGGSPSPGRQNEKKQNSSSLSQNSTTEPAVVFKVDPQDKHIQLRNASTEDQQLGGWVLKIQVNNNKPIIHTYRKPFNLKAGQVFNVVCHDYRSLRCPVDLVLEELTSWNPADTVQVSLISDTGAIQYNSVYNP
ncbi:lamin-A-like [Sparus aurata]|uniref:lamin-A-like n=1 Tax=Sparus aurata TaxID=8175 RepID=UPI0011C1C41E|nr:lamin-A-like [Sparus aurata]